jgi:hypothetical protein
MNNQIEVYIIAYNNLFCVEYQIKSFKAFCLDPHKLIIVDSNCGEHLENSRQKKLICEKYGIEIIEIPEEHGKTGHKEGPSAVLSRKLDYVYHSVIKERNPKYFAFLDQDFFPFKKFSVVEDLEKYGMYGDVLERSDFKSPADSIEEIVDGPWALHPWLSFYKYDFVKDYDLSWYPSPGFDTGGKNWDNFISKLNPEKKNYWRRHKTIMYFPFDEISGAGPSPYELHFFSWNGENVYSQVQIYDGKFIHMLNSKYLDDPMNPKTNWCKGFLDMAILVDGDTEFDESNGFHNEGPSNKI